MSQSSFLSRIDHLVYAVPALAKGITEIEDVLGVRPVYGGSHESWGTHNALLSLGPSMYLELMAADPSRASLNKPVLFELDKLLEPKLITWVLREEEIESAFSKAISSGLPIGDVLPGSRQRPDGTSLKWRITDPNAFPMDGAVPFLISWGQTPHPGTVAPFAGHLRDFRIEHPDPSSVADALAILGVEAGVHKSDFPQLTATIETDHGPVVLK